MTEKIIQFPTHVDIPYIIHGDPGEPKFAYPTHTHGLEKIKWPEIFINATAFGAVGNAQTINEVFMYLSRTVQDYDKLVKDKFVEIDLWAEYETEMMICLRMVGNDFLAVKKAYHEDNRSPFGYAQLYVKGDAHVLIDSFYEKAGTNKSCSCPTC